MSEKHFVFLKDNRVENIYVFADQNQELANQVCQEQGFDEAIWIDDSEIPARWSTYDGKTFTKPTEEYLISINVIRKPVENGEV